LEGLRIENVAIFCGHLEYFKAIWYILRSLGNAVAIFPVLVCCVKKNLATLISGRKCTVASVVAKPSTVVQLGKNDDKNRSTCIITQLHSSLEQLCREFHDKNNF
jgi:hypothetical protein